MPNSVWALLAVTKPCAPTPGLKAKTAGDYPGSGYWIFRSHLMHPMTQELLK